MSYNGNGQFNINTSGQPVSPNTLISSAVFNALTADLATGLSTCITKDGQTTVTANIPLGGFKLTGVGAGSLRTDAATLATIQDGTGVYVATVGGTTDVITLTPAPAITSYTAGQGFFWIASGANTGAVTVAISGLVAKALTKNGNTALIAGDIPSGSLIFAAYDGTQLQIRGTVPAGLFLKLTGGTMTGDITMTAASIITAEGASVAAASSTNIWATDGNTIHITGNTGIADFGTAPQVGAWMRLIFDGTPILTQSANLNLNAGGANVTMAADDLAFVYADTTTQMDVFIIRKSGAALVNSVIAATQNQIDVGTDLTAFIPPGRNKISLGTEQLSTSGTAIDFTSIPSGVRRITIMLVGVSTNGTSNLLVQIGDSGGIENSGYISRAQTGGGTTTGSTAGFILTSTTMAANATITGTIVLSLENGTNFTVVSASGLSAETANDCYNGAGYKATSAELDRVRITTVNGTDAFDAGVVNIQWEK